ncbi:MAG: hypothetical protein RL213_10 [Bacteroidota bacterium]
MGHVNNACYLSYLEQARIRYFNELVGWEWDWGKDGIILAKAEVVYRQPIHLHDPLRVMTRCSRIGDKSMTLEYRLIRQKNDSETLLAEASTVIVCFDYEKKLTVRVPDSWREAVLTYEAAGSVEIA